MKQATVGLVLVLLVAGEVAAAGKRQSPDTLVGSPVEATRHILAALDAPDVDRRIERLGRHIVVEPESATTVMDELQRDGSPQAATLRAELLLWLARGNDVRDGSHKGEMSTEQLGLHAVGLLDHADPFVGGIAEWALATRLGMEYECAESRVQGKRIARTWPGQDAPPWYQQWAALDAGRGLELDYVRQAAAWGWHRTTDGLLKSAESIAQRADALLVHIQKNGAPEQVLAARGHIAKVREVHRRLSDAAKSAPTDLTGQRKLWLTLRRAARDVALDNPDLNFNQIVFGVRQAARSNGNITNGRWNTHTPGGDIVIKTGFAPSDPVRALLKGRLGPGHVRGLELNWDADKLVFAYARQDGRAGGQAKLPANSDVGGYFGQGVGAVEEMSHLFEVKVDGSGLRQLTDARYNADQEPCYLPSGDIAFVSDRSNFGSQCAGALEQDNMILNLYRCDPNGRDIRPLSNNKDFDRHPHVMGNGQLLFLHWEYQERHLWQTHALWTCRPDGAMTDAIYKQHINSGPMSLREARQIWGMPTLVAIACGHHNYDQGAVFLADYSLGINEREGMRNLTPGVSDTEGGYGGIKSVAEGGVQDRGGHYMFPYPLSEKSFLVSYSYKRPESNAGQNYALYYIDVWGNKELIHRDQKLSVAFLAPLRPTPRPPVLPELPQMPEGQPRWGVVLVADVHAEWPKAEAGRVKHLRISQKVPWPCVRDESKACGFNDLHWMPSAWEPVLGLCDWGSARVIGIVPVEADGSAHFKVPADQPVYFQALDENYLELRRMRSNVTLKAGENRSCIGCHETKGSVIASSANASVRMALRRPPSLPVPPSWGDRVVPDFEKHIQPIFDAHCVRCHGEQKPEGGLEFTSRKMDGYTQSYRTIFGLKATDPTPIAKNWWNIWRPNETPPGEAEFVRSKAFLEAILKNPPYQLVAIANYTSGAQVTPPKPYGSANIQRTKDSVSGYFNPEATKPFGSANSKLTLTLIHDAKHKKEVKMSQREWISLVTWVDLNAQYWGTFVDKDRHYASKRAGKNGGPVVPPRRVNVIFPDPWLRPPAGEWVWQDEHTAGLK